MKQAVDDQAPDLLLKRNAEPPGLPLGLPEVDEDVPPISILMEREGHHIRWPAAAEPGAVVVDALRIAAEGNAQLSGPDVEGAGRGVDPPGDIAGADAQAGGIPQMEGRQGTVNPH